MKRYKKVFKESNILGNFVENQMSKKVAKDMEEYFHYYRDSEDYPNEFNFEIDMSIEDFIFALMYAGDFKDASIDNSLRQLFSSKLGINLTPDHDYKNASFKELKMYAKLIRDNFNYLKLNPTIVAKQIFEPFVQSPNTRDREILNELKGATWKDIEIIINGKAFLKNSNPRLSVYIK